ncbi:MAG: hypothetical protein ACK4NM_15210 [Hydrogenophaga sp.]
MYGYLVLKKDKSIDTIFVSWLQFAKIRADTPQQKAQWENAALEVFKKLCPLNDPLRKRLNPEDVKKLFFRVPVSERSYGISLWLAHQRLSEPLRNERAKTIERIVGDHLGDAAALDTLIEPVKELKALALLIADDLIDNDLRDHCCLILNTYLPLTPFFQKTLQPTLNAILGTVQNKPAVQFNAIKNHVWLLTCTRAAHQREGFLSQLLRLFKQSKSQLLLDAGTSASKLSTPLPNPIFYDALSQMVADALVTDTDSHQEIIEARLNIASALYESRKNRATAITMQAVAAGVILGDRTEQSQEAIIEIDRERSLQDRKRTRDCTKRARDRKGGVPIPSTSAQQAETALLQAWPLQQLAQWIEGPITEKRKTPGGIDRKAILLKEQKQQPPQEKKPPPKQKAPPSDDLTPDDVDSTIQQALSATAEFFLAEIGDLLTLAKQLNALPNLVAGCIDLLEPLQRLAAPPEPPVEDEATALLTKAELAILELRAGLKSAESSAKLQRCFTDALIAALRTEPLELGKRHGGQIGYKTRAEDWTFVCDNFHNRWLPQTTSILVNGVHMQLQTNQAVALYVTGSSQSGYAFDVSVHLWQRRLGKQTMPSAKNDLFPPMNQEDWFDTLVPCCVLHVPSAE